MRMILVAVEAEDMKGGIVFQTDMLTEVADLMIELMGMVEEVETGFLEVEEEVVTVVTELVMVMPVVTVEEKDLQE